MVPYRVSNPSRRTSGRSARAPSRATSPHPLAGGPQSEVRRGADFLTCPVRPCVLRPRHRPPRLLPWSSAAPCPSSVGAGRPPAVGLVQCTRCTPGVWGLPSGACSPSPCNGVFLPGHVIPHGTARVAVVPSGTSSFPLTFRVSLLTLSPPEPSGLPLSPLTLIRCSSAQGCQIVTASVDPVGRSWVAGSLLSSPRLPSQPVAFVLSLRFRGCLPPRGDCFRVRMSLPAHVTVHPGWVAAGSQGHCFRLRLSPPSP